jgi:hypothetical protein
VPRVTHAYVAGCAVGLHLSLIIKLAAGLHVVNELGRSFEDLAALMSI